MCVYVSCHQKLDTTMSKKIHLVHLVATYFKHFIYTFNCKYFITTVTICIATKKSKFILYLILIPTVICIETKKGHSY